MARMGITPGDVFDCVNLRTKDVQVLERQGIVHHERLEAAY
jgi:hypothetical protein